MNDWELTDEQISKAAFDAYAEWEVLPQRYSIALADYQRRAIATAAQKKLVEWSEGECKHDSKCIRRCCDLCWRDVRAAGEGK